MNHDQSQPEMHKPAPESRYRDEDDWSPHSRHHGHTHQNHQAAEPGGDHQQQAAPINVDHDQAAAITMVNMARIWDMAAMVIMPRSSATGSG
jgi:hypothetical protein